MDQNAILTGLVLYLCFIPVLTFHEWAHAWSAWKLGDDTAKLQGRVSLNPIVHMEFVGTVVLPLLAIFLASSGSMLAGFIIGWGRPVPVNLNNLANPRRDDTLIALAGPGINLLMAIVLMIGIKVGIMMNSQEMVEIFINLVRVSLVLCFFNLIPIPPLDGSHVVKNVLNISHEAYWRAAQYGFILVILALQFTPLRRILSGVVHGVFGGLLALYGIR